VEVRARPRATHLQRRRRQRGGAVAAAGRRHRDHEHHADVCPGTDREIGLRRVVGATARNIVVQFLTEGLLVTMTGGVVGIVAGVATAHAITAPAAWSTSASLIAVVLAFSVSAVVGLVFGPTEAELRSEMTGRVDIPGGRAAGRRAAAGERGRAPARRFRSKVSSSRGNGRSVPEATDLGPEDMQTTP